MNIKLDAYEQDLEDNFEKAKRYSAKQVKQELRKAHMAAKNYAIKDKRISIRVYGRDLDHIRNIALREGLKFLHLDYQRATQIFYGPIG